MANNLRDLRRVRHWSQDQASAALGTTRSQYAKLERGERRLSDKWIDRASAAYGVDAGQVVASPIVPPTIVGSVENDGTIQWQSGAPPQPDTPCGLTIGAGALGPLFDGATLLTRCRRTSPEQLVDGRSYLVLCDCWLLRTVHVAQSKAAWHLSGWNVPTLFDLSVRAAIVIEGIQL